MSGVKRATVTNSLNKTMSLVRESLKQCAERAEKIGNTGKKDLDRKRADAERIEVIRELPPELREFLKGETAQWESLVRRHDETLKDAGQMYSDASEKLKKYESKKTKFGSEIDSIQKKADAIRFLLQGKDWYCDFENDEAKDLRRKAEKVVHDLEGHAHLCTEAQGIAQKCFAKYSESENLAQLAQNEYKRLINLGNDRKEKERIREENERNAKCLAGDLRSLKERIESRDFNKFGGGAYSSAEQKLLDSVEALVSAEKYEQALKEAGDLKARLVKAAEKIEDAQLAWETAKAAAEKAERKAAEQGDAEAQYILGRRYHDGEGVVKDYALAVWWYRKAAEQGHSGAQNSLGVCYGKGEGVVKNYAEAVKWYRKAAEQGNRVAQSNLSISYYHGKGVVKNYAEAVKWCRKAAEQGNETAQKNIDEYIERWKEEKEAFKIMCFVDGVIFLLWLLGFIYVWKWQGVTGISYMPTPGSSIKWYCIIAAFFMLLEGGAALCIWKNPQYKFFKFFMVILHSLKCILLTCLIYVYSANFSIFSGWNISAIVVAAIYIVIISLFLYVFSSEEGDNKDNNKDNFDKLFFFVLIAGLFFFLLCWLLCYPFTVSGKERLAERAGHFPEYRNYYLQRAAEARNKKSK